MIATAVYPEDAVTTGETLLQIYAANADRALSIREIHFSWRSAASQEVTLEVVIQTDAGGGGTSVTPVKNDQTDPDGIEATASRLPTASSWTSPAPTTTDILKSGIYDSPGEFTWQATSERDLRIPGGSRIAVRFPVAPTASVDVRGYITWEE